MLWTLLLLNEFDLIFHDDFSTTAKRYEGWTLVGDAAQQNLGLVRPGEQVLLDGQGLQQATLRWLDDQANVVGEDPWLEGMPATAPPAARAVGLTRRQLKIAWGAWATSNAPTVEWWAGPHSTKPSLGKGLAERAVLCVLLARSMNGTAVQVWSDDSKFVREQSFAPRCLGALQRMLRFEAPRTLACFGWNAWLKTAECWSGEKLVRLTRKKNSGLMVSGTKQVVKCQRQSARFPVEWCWCLCNQNLSLEPSTLTISRSTLKIRICSFMKNLTK
jgi:hypothetical protein